MNAQAIISEVPDLDNLPKSARVPFSKKSNRKHVVDFFTTKRAPWWENAPDDLTPFRRDFYTNVKKLAAAEANKKGLNAEEENKDVNDDEDNDEDSDEA